MNRIGAHGAGCLLAWAPLLAMAQDNPVGKADAATLDAVEVVGQRISLADFPGSVHVLSGDTWRDGQRQASLSEVLGRVPGVSVLDRQNLAQDLQVQSRGFGARSSFGIRGIRLVVDGIPSSALDGQGQAANFPLATLDRIEVLRGPLALQYGNAAGGAIVGSSDLDEVDAQAFDAWAGSDGSRRAGVRIDGAGRNWRWRMHGSHYATTGSRPHAAAERSQLVALAEWHPREGERLRLVANLLAQPDTEDPLGVTPEQWRADPRASAPAAIAFDTRKRIGNRQVGLRWERDYSPGRSLWLGGYGVQRDIVQFLSIPIAAQQAPTSSGGVVDVGRGEAGFEAGHRWSGAHAVLALGVQAGTMDEIRRGYENFVGSRLGVRGRLRRDERNRVRIREAFALGQWTPRPGWSVLAGTRASRLSIRSMDRYLAPGNGDDSGSLAYAEHAHSLGVSRAFAWGEAFASAGRGFETPTITELAYRADGAAGFNTALRPAHHRSFELGARWRSGTTSASLAAFAIDARDEIVAASSSGGRSSHANAGRTRRSGLEASLEGELARGWSYLLAANVVRARFADGFAYAVSGTEVRVAAGNRVPGVAASDGHAELSWRGADERLAFALEVHGNGPIAVDDRNTTSAPGSARLALRLRWRAGNGWHVFARIDNVLDREHIGSVIVNEGNSRWFEPGAGRGLTLGFGWNGGAYQL